MSGGEPSSIKRNAVCAVRVPDLSRLLLHRAYRIIQGKVCSLAKDRFLFSQKRRDGFCTKLCTGNTGRKPLTMWWGSRSSPKRSRPRCVPDGLATPIFLSAPAARAKRPARSILAKAVNCEHPVDGNPCNECDACRGIEDGSVLDVVELDAASNNGVDDVRDAARRGDLLSDHGSQARVHHRRGAHALQTGASTRC